MAFLAIPSGVADTIVGRTTHVADSYEKAEEWAKEYIKSRKERVEKAKNPRQAKKQGRSFARLRSVIIYEDAGKVIVE